MNEENNGTTNNGGKSRFFERLKRIQSAKRIRKQCVENEDNLEKNVNYDVRRIFKPFLVISAFLYGTVQNDNKKQKNNNIVSNNQSDTYNINDIQKTIHQDKIKRHLNLSALSINDNQKELSDVNRYSNAKIEEQKLSSDVKIKELQTEIINLIKKRLVQNMNELEILQSELYILKEITGEDVYLIQCQENVKEVKKLLTRIKTLKEKYDYLKENTNFDYLLEINDDSLVDKIIELKDMCAVEDIKQTIDNYKILEEYKYLYLKIDKLEENISNFNNYKLQQEEELKERDIEFEKLKEEVYVKNNEQEKYDNFIKEQNMLFNKINEKIFDIDSHEVVTYKLKGFNLLVANSFKYLGLLLASPFKGFLPGIITETMVTKSIISNLYNNLEWEEKRKMVYETIDFSMSIRNSINDLDKTLNLVNTTLEDVKRLKEKYQKDFSKYEYSFSEYSDIIKKINKMENAIANNKIKIQLMQEKMKIKEKENEEKIKRVKKLNCSTNN